MKRPRRRPRRERPRPPRELPLLPSVNMPNAVLYSDAVDWLGVRLAGLFLIHDRDHPGKPRPHLDIMAMRLGVSPRELPARVEALRSVGFVCYPEAEGGGA